MRRAFTSAVVTLTLALALSLSGCGTESRGVAPTDVAPSGAIKPRAISWLLSRPADGPVITTMRALAEEYAASHPGFKLNLISTPDRPSYIQKYETLAAAGKLPELFDTDATPFAQKLAHHGRMMDVAKLLRNLGLYDHYRPAALDYQRFDDGSLYMVPLQYEAEFFWYNKALLRRAGVSVPTSLDDFPAMCRALRSAGITPIALDGQDLWPLERYAAYQPFRVTGPSYVRQLKNGEARFSEPAGRKSAEWLSALGKAGCFQKGFSSVGYADAQNLFASGRAAVYNTGTWDLPGLATTALDTKTRDDVDFFTLPLTRGSVTAENEYVTSSGIGMAVNSRTYDPLVRDFLKFALTRYPARYAAAGVLAPTTDAKTVVPDNATPLYARAVATANDVGQKIAVPWDTQLDPTTNTKFQQNLVLLAQGDVSPASFISTMDTVIRRNAPRYSR
ncbi:extracellular solute-binding protein [Streptomyces malaysiensis subsp. malaysiensis]|uniref:Carbohydrate ABC transporter substrate-binding protein n=1 Tax=Streptomyces malaysiensis TaxID=92644 RepID=A0ABX6WN19_STRMQ|nr:MULTISPECIES: ABC transporter substrate-binding protein [Streptomyces]MCM3812797.1 ABC transporter substrate-binding protein [Streptomyces sp. DR7-3]QPI61436.1 carbohydrate ABC transporter substrate-binding protein [Streptomyces solisilvae]UHH23219.1 ABC transporter substrate-binding protein [Streptomyces sp. HNM0561]